ncbi:hypothetical protein FQB35_04750 [Crassaminicella thermophila]|uniref:Uncharacterized protein n=1 Tax=Crassaminicella thermophila TaxID=2599308 RepID=A0A5C0SCQ6_CRATE|nr:hypothetical protein [Crassaminicella thermophila]QEK11727.1 hypothetical protein FQB35_04750 [Crassaminicella thermophila]
MWYFTKKAVFIVFAFILSGVLFILLKLLLIAGKVIVIELLGETGEILINAVGICCAGLWIYRKFKCYKNKMHI